MDDEPSTLSSFAQKLQPKPRPLDRLLRPITVFARHKLAGAGLLMLATALALIAANTGLAHSYHHLLELELGVTVGDFSFGKTIHHWVNDGLMGIFFFLVGLEIKRELMVGELSTVRKATLPAIAAVGGMIVPAGIYYALNPSGPGASGWGVPMATDIAFALGVLALLGDRIPLGLKVFLTALAIVDDIGAVLVIAVFYTSDLSVWALVAGAVCLILSVGLNLLGTRNPVPYFILGTAAWLGFLESGVHATIAALLMAFTIPARTRIDGGDFLGRMKLLMGKMDADVPVGTTMNSNVQQHLFEKMNETIDFASAPLQRIEHALSGPVTFVILPIFALANAGVSLSGEAVSELANPIVLGIVLGLFVGKTVGITASAWLAVKLRVADLPAGVGWAQVTGVGTLGGIGFTMALFVATLAFGDPSQVEVAKLGIMVGSAVSGVFGYLFVRFAAKPRAVKAP